MITLETLTHWLNEATENEHLEFKEAKKQYDTIKLLKYCVALANEGGGYLIFGVTDKKPRKIIGSAAYPTPEAQNKIKKQILEKLHIRVELTELNPPEGRVLIFEIPSRPTGQAINLDGAYWMRSGEDLVPMTPDRLKAIFAEDQQDWFIQSAREKQTLDQIINLLDTPTYFELKNLPYPTDWDAILDRLANDQLIVKQGKYWNITNLGAILFARNLEQFPLYLSRKAPRFIIYEGTGKLFTKNDITGKKGYAAGFESLIDFVHNSAPQNQFIEEVIREEAKMFPKQALRELIANALIHQDFQATGASVMIEMYSDRVEISNPGLPPIRVERFIDEYRSRNEQLADLMRRLGICEEKGSGIDKVIVASEVYQLPAPDFRVGETRTTAILFAHQDFTNMTQTDRIRACYQHCCLQYVSNNKMSNTTLKERFKLGRTKTATVSHVIRATKDAGLIKQDTSESDSTRYARYLPFWA
ncbi:MULTISPECIES: ATP-binding protein [Cyanophyceae]|uniref:ATP-binding protein n=1 Tax=Cyanophyceae TaxID=3028117 RepID=UPI0002D6702C|nr:MULTISPECIES: ATP-binding protein [Cyanophyceae]SMH59162.1 ATP-dependent DNA helicase RecG [Picosynechococcus sp. OG1]SMQ86569.1 ATP-dependent DNA helicase RecG [Synechococcus sp. 7002]